MLRPLSRSRPDITCIGRQVTLARHGERIVTRGKDRATHSDGDRRSRFDVAARGQVEGLSRPGPPTRTLFGPRGAIFDAVLFGAAARGLRHQGGRSLTDDSRNPPNAAVFGSSSSVYSGYRFRHADLFWRKRYRRYVPRDAASGRRRLHPIPRRPRHRGQSLPRWTPARTFIGPLSFFRERLATTRKLERLATIGIFLCPTKAVEHVGIRSPRFFDRAAAARRRRR